METDFTQKGGTHAESALIKTATCDTVAEPSTKFCRDCVHCVKDSTEPKYEAFERCNIQPQPFEVLGGNLVFAWINRRSDDEGFCGPTARHFQKR